jgi:heptose I phosphotransferase
MKESLWRRLVTGACRLHHDPRWARFAGARWEERIMDVPVTDRFHAKQGRSIGRWVLHADDERLVVYLKRHYRLGWWRGLMALLRPDRGWSPALEEWANLQEARAAGLPVPAALASGEYIGPWGRLQSFLAVEELTGMLALHEAIPAAAAHLDPLSFQRWKTGLTRAVAELVRFLHERRWFHKDLYLCHFYIAEEDTRRLPTWSGKVRLIDLHRLQRHPRTGLWWQVKDLAQLLYSSDVVGVTNRDRLRFWVSYLGAARRRHTSRFLRWMASVKASLYHRHNRSIS